METSDPSENKLREYSEENNISLRDVARNLIVMSLPHLALIAIFVVYTLVGAAILKEIENDKTLHSSDDTIIVPQEGSILEKVKEHNQIYAINHQNFYLNFIAQIDNSLNTEMNIEQAQDDKIESQPVPFISSLNKKQKNRLNATDVFKTIAKHLIQFKKELKNDLKSNLNSFITDFNSKQNEISKNIDILIDDNLPYFESSRKARKLDDDKKKKGQNQIFEWNLKQSIYFIGSLVTTLGFGNVGPETLMGKIFLITYLTIGVPLTSILLSDIGSIFTQILKFNYHFIETIYSKGYYDDFKRVVKSKFSSKKKKYSKFKKEKAFNDPFDETDSEDSKSVSSILSSDYEEKGYFQLFLEIVVNSIEKSNDRFDFSISIVFGLVLFFITSGAFVISRLNNVPFSNGCYYGVIAFNKINILDLKITNTIIFMLLTIYFLLGLAFFDLTLLTLQEKIRNLIIVNGKNITNEVCKFANQLGYNWHDELIISVLENLGTNSFFKSRNLSNKLAEERDTTSIEMPKTPKNRNAKKFRYSVENNVKKSDKQTQITTLLFSKYRMDNKVSTSLSASCSNLSDFSNSPIQTASIRSSTLYVDKLIEENLNRREFDLKTENSKSRLKKSDRFSFESPISPSSYSSIRSRRFN